VSQKTARGLPNPTKDTEREGTQEVEGARLEAHKATDARQSWMGREVTVVSDERRTRAGKGL